MKEKLKLHDGDTPGKVIEVKLEYPKKDGKMSELICPFCQQELKCWDEPQDAIYSNWSCPNCRRFAYGNKLIWQELIKLMEDKDLSDKIGKLETELDRTRKALDVAVDALKQIDWCATDYAKAQDALDEITALTKGGDNE